MSVFLIHEPRSVFIHIPKTGGTSIRRGLFGDVVEGPTQGFVPPEWMSCFKYAFVRNPYDRVISAWKMFASGMENSVWKHPQDERGLSLQRFLEIATDESISFDGRRETTSEKIRHHAIPQTHPFNCLEFADFVGRFEQLDSDFAKVCEQLKYDAGKLPRWNQTNRKREFMSYFDSVTRAIVEQFYAEDFSQLGYSMADQVDL